MTLPRALQGSDDSAALQLLDRYYGGPGHDTPAVGASFDAWDAPAPANRTSTGSPQTTSSL